MNKLDQPTFGHLSVTTLGTEEEFGRAVAQQTAKVLKAKVDASGKARVVLATGNSQLPLMRALREEHRVPWGSITVFHMDEYLGMHPDHSASFHRWIRQNVVEPFNPAAAHYIDGEARDPEQEACRYEELLRAEPLDLVCMGIGENGHLAFNEPYQVDFLDRRWVRVVELDEVSRRQQVSEGHFSTISAVPSKAISLTIPALLAASNVVVSVPEGRKAEAVQAALTGPISESCPASILREQKHAWLFLDSESSALVDTRPTHS